AAGAMDLPGFPHRLRRYRQRARRIRAVRRAGTRRPGDAEPGDAPAGVLAVRGAVAPAAAGAPVSARARRAAALAIMALVAILAACCIRIGSIDLRFDSIDASLVSGIGFSFTVVVRDSVEWTRLWLDHDSRIHPPRPPPHVDFGRDIVV